MRTIERERQLALELVNGGNIGQSAKKLQKKSEDSFDSIGLEDIMQDDESKNSIKKANQADRSVDNAVSEIAQKKSIEDDQNSKQSKDIDFMNDNNSAANYYDFSKNKIDSPNSISDKRRKPKSRLDDMMVSSMTDLYSQIDNKLLPKSH